MGLRQTAQNAALSIALIVIPLLSACSSESTTPLPAGAPLPSTTETAPAPDQNVGGMAVTPPEQDPSSAAGGPGVVEPTTGGAPGTGGTGTQGEGTGGAGASAGAGGATMSNGGSGGTQATGGSGGSATPAQPVLECDKDKQKEPANILFVLADDQSFNTIAAHGNTEVKTRNIDELAASGVSFTRAYNMGAWNGAVCIASRTMFNTGRFLWKANDLNKKAEENGGRLWAQQLKKSGYKTYMSGKWHVVGVDAQKAFDRTAHVRPGMPKITNDAYDRPKAGNNWSPYDKSKGGFWDGGKHWSEVLADDAEAFLDEAKGSDDPFFMYLAFNAPHDPRQSPKKFVDMYPVKDLEVPKSFLPLYPHREGMESGKDLRDERLAPFPRTPEAVKVHRQEYYALITHMDEQIGRILDALKRSGKADNTYIIFTADHGLAMGSHGLLGKQNMYEHSMRSPMIIVGPGLPAGAEVKAPVYIQDVVPTTFDMAQATTPNYVDFKSLMPLACGERESNYDRIYGAYLKEAQRMVSDGRYKLIKYPKIGNGKWRLFDMETDPDEMVDLIDAPEHEDRVAALRMDLAKLETEMGGGQVP